MRATMRITWLLLSLSILFHSVCLSTQLEKSAGGGTSGTVTTSKPATNATTGTIGTPTTAVATKDESTLAVTSAKQQTTSPTPTTSATDKLTDKPASTQSQAPTVTTNTPALPTNSSGAAVSPSLPETMTPTATGDSNNSSVVSPSVSTTQTPKASEPNTTSVTAASGLAGNGNVGTTKITKVSTGAPTSGSQSMTHTTIPSKTSQVPSKGATEKTIVTVTSRQQTTTRSPEPVGSMGTISTLPTSTETRPPAAETLSTTAGTTSTPTTTSTTTAAQPQMFLYSLNKGHEKEEEKDLVEVCRRLMANLQDGNCTLTWRLHNGKIQFDCVEINGKVKTNLATQYYEEITKSRGDNKTLIAILASCGALLIMIVILAVCASHHRKPFNENQQHLTEELHTVENGYHDNPTLEVMEVQPEMQEKKMALNGEFNDSWIVPIDNLLKEDIPDEEDTHL